MATTVIVVLEPLTCGVVGCGVPFGISRSLYDKAQVDPSVFFWCPNGHHIHYGGDSAEEKLRKAETRETALRDQLEASAREAELVRGALLRDRQRFANGVCPCCNRSFDNVRRHMATKHPGYDVTKVQQRPKVIQFGCSCGRSFDTLQGLHRHQTAQRGSKWYAPDASRYSAHLTKV